MTHWHILGAGAIGSFVAYRMHLHQRSYSLLHHHQDVEERVVVDGEVETALVAEPLHSLKRGSIEHLLLTTKAGQLLDALNLALPYLSPGAIIACTANGLGFEEAMRGGLSGRMLYRAISTAGAYRDAQNRVHIASLGRIRMGAADGSTEAPHWFCDSLEPLEEWRWEGDIARAIAEKFSINCVINPLTAQLRCHNGELLQGDTPGPDLVALCRESEPALRALGLWSGDPALLDTAVEICRQTALNRSSMLQDVIAGRPTEIAYLNGELLRRAEPLGLELPINHALVNALR
ncbi:ketopantoate reductase family protein [Congregibacter litoralis]|uniref:2-dehydropantoate 2-reductase n=1 Tax=Congregibacter litoralis KT71 TaxID=314285 RepID=A4A5I8_9GAMM|nr:2-dehydropantoate 2-reductase [Congregibacter litoralis]EAQ99059.1 ketopantoate reductase [Congregibacter litoralis KT71]